MVVVKQCANTLRRMYSCIRAMFSVKKDFVEKASHFFRWRFTNNTFWFHFVLGRYAPFPNKKTIGKLIGNDIDIKISASYSDR